jgi:Ca-activated chloride channel homolog
MKRLLIHLVAVALLAGSVQAEESARRSFDAGLSAFNASNYPDAGEAFQAAAATAPEEQLDPATAFYNAALAAHEAGDDTAAADLYSRAAASTDLDLQAKAYYNRGNTLFQQAGGPAQALSSTTPMPSPDLDAAGDSIDEAIQMYENAIALNPADVDAKANYELAVLKQQEIQQQQQEQQDDQQQDQQDKSQEQQDQQEKQDQQQDQQNQEQEPQPPEPSPGEDQEEQKEEGQSTQAPEASEEMTEEEAEMMLDAMKAQEQSQRDQLHPFLGNPIPVEKDW